jgi:hypothetical protein
MSVKIGVSQRVHSSHSQRRPNDGSRTGSRPQKKSGASVVRSVKRSMRRISKVVKKDIKEAKKIWLPWPAIFCLFVLALLLRGMLKDSGLLYLYRPIWNGVLVFGFLFYLKWRLRRHAWFWATMAAVAALHVLLILFVPWTNKWVPALVTAGVDSLDICLVFWILGIVEEFAGGPNDDGSET